MHRVANDMNVGHELRGKCRRIDRTPAGLVGCAGDVRDIARFLRRDHIGDLRVVIAEISDQRVGRGLDRNDAAALRQRNAFDHAGIEFLPGFLEQPLLRKGVLGVENENLGARLLCFQIMRDQAGALIRRGRTPIGSCGNRQHDHAAILHRLQLPAQQQGLLAGLPGMGHFFGCRLVIARQGIEPQVDARRKHQPVVGKRCSVGEANGSCLRIDLGGGLRDHGHAAGGNLFIAELLRLDIAQSRDHLVAERTGGESPVRFDERHLQFGIDLSQGARATGAAKAAADDDHAGAGLRIRRAGERKRRRCRREAANDISPRRHQPQRIHQHVRENERRP